METINKLTERFSEFPGIGPRQAKRFVYFLLTRQNGYLEELAKLVLNVKKEIALCTECFRFFPKKNTVLTICNICGSKTRDKKLLMIVGRDVDFENLEKSGVYNGHYFVLGGSIPVLEKEPEKKIRIKNLVECVQKKQAEGLKEIILALSVNPEGENTMYYIKNTLEPLLKESDITISMLGRGLSTGTELEYSDTETIKNALKNRG